MNKLILTLALLYTASPVFAAETKCAAPQSVAKVNGMVCDFCAQSMIKTFKKNPSVSDVKIDLTTKLVTIETKPGEKISDQEIKKLVDYSGYELVSVDHVCKKKS